MALKIQIFDGANVLEDPIQITLKASRVGLARYVLSFAVTEDDPNLTQKLVTAKLRWGDGSLPIVFPSLPAEAQPSPITMILTRDFKPGFYLIRLDANNYRLPERDKQTAVVQVTVLGDAIPVKQVPTLYGPILPRDVGYPNAQQWNLDAGEDLKILESSVRMLLITGRGERLMEPNYGTNLKQIIFTSDYDAARVFIEQEIVNAISAWEPRVLLQTYDYTKNGSSATVNAVFVSKLSQQSFQINLEFEVT